MYRASAMSTSLTPEDRQRRLSAFTHSFRDVFARSDQRQRLQAYLHGLLDGPERKNLEGIASQAAGGAPTGALAQALQHFVSTSPWEADRLLARYRALLAGQLDGPDRVWVVQDLAFPKKGRHSVGAQRQLARSLGGKVNCQLAV